LKFVMLLLAIWSTSAVAHEVQLITQHLDIRRQNKTAWQSDFLARAEVSRKFDVGLQATYLERFNFFEKRMGGFVTYRPKDNIIIEGKVLLGHKNSILPEKDYYLNTFFALAPGLSPFVFLRDSDYSVTHIRSVKLGLEIEKFANIILIPQLLGGKATFASPADTQNIFNYGLKVVYYKDSYYSVSIFGYKGQEASQGIIGASNFLVDTTTGGASVSYHFIPDLKTELIFDYTDYRQLKNQFLTSTLNLAWRFE
jgi:hypothetical protein